MLKLLIVLFMMKEGYPAISISSVKENYACVQNGVVNTPCTTPGGDLGTCIHSQDCIAITNVDRTGSGSISRRRHRPAILTPSSGTLVCCIASKTGKAAFTSNDSVSPKIKRVKRSSPSGDCGWRNPNNSSGHQSLKGEAINGELPWVVNVLEVTGSKDNGTTFTFKYIGGGALIRRRIVLTAAHVVHKVPSGMIYVAVGDHDQYNRDEKQKKIMKAFDTIIHENFDADALSNDIAVLLINDIPNLPNIKSICLPTPSMEPPTDAVCFQSGWAKDKTKYRHHILSKIEMSIVDRHTCQNRLYRSSLGLQFQLSESFICAIGQPDVDTCKGSGGSPLICSMKGQEGRFEIWGIAAGTLHCGQDGFPDLFTHVSHLRSWIETQLFNLAMLNTN